MTTTTKTSKAASASKSATITATITGSLARKIGKHAKVAGISPSEAVLRFATIGESVTAPTPKSAKKKLAEVGPAKIHYHRPIYFPAESVQLLEELLEASGTALSVDQYAMQFLQQEIVASLRPLADGVPEILAGSYQLEPGDMASMQRVVDRWIEKEDNPQVIFDAWVAQIENS